MAEPLNLTEDSAFSAALRWLGRPGYVTRNILRGDIGGAARQFGDLVLDPLDAVLPGDLIPEVSRKQDYVEASDLIGGMDEGIGKLAVDVGGGMLTDPLTYTGIGLLTKPLSAAAGGLGKGVAQIASKTAAGAQAVDAIKSGAKSVGYGIRSATGNLRPTQDIAEAVAAGGAKGAATGKAGAGFAVEAFSKFDPETQARAFSAIRGVDYDAATGMYRDLDAAIGLAKPTSPFIDEVEQMARIDQRLNAMPMSASERAQAQAAAREAMQFVRGQWNGGLRDKVFSAPEMYQDAAGNLHTVDDLKQVYAANPATNKPAFDAWAQQMGFTKSAVPDTLSPADYLPGVYEMDTAAATAMQEGGKRAALTMPKELRDSKALSEWLNKNKSKLDTDLPMVLGKYSEQMGTAVKQAEIGQKLIKGWSSLVENKKALMDKIDEIRATGDLDSAMVLETAVKGLPPRQGIEDLLAKFNGNLFKKFATGGAYLPRVAYTTRNVVAGVPMVAAEPAARQVALKTAARVPGTIIGAWRDGLEQLGLPIAKADHITDVENAIRLSGGDRVKMLNAIQNPTLRSAVEHGVIDSGFVSSEDLAAAMVKAGQSKMTHANLRDWPQAIAKGGEDRMRLGLFEDLVKAGMPDAEAANVVKKSLYDYAYSSALNRRMRDWIPFFQFTAKAVPQQAKFLAGSGRIPSFGRNLAEQLYQKDENEVLPPYLQGAPAINIGRDAEDNPQYLTSFGLPWEALQSVPNLSDNPFTALRQTRQNVVGMVTPPVKTAASAVFGIDPYFGTPFGSYDKAPQALQSLGMEERSDAGRVYNILAGSGAIQPISAPLGVLSNAVDDRTTLGQKFLNTATGVRVKSVDEDRALQQLVEQKLRTDPSIQRHETLYAYSPDEEQQALLDQLREIKRILKAKRQVDLTTSPQ